jgi:hypothetical protein
VRGGSLPASSMTVVASFPGSIVSRGTSATPMPAATRFWTVPLSSDVKTTSGSMPLALSWASISGWWLQLRKAISGTPRGVHLIDLPAKPRVRYVQVIPVVAGWTRLPVPTCHAAGRIVLSIWTPAGGHKTDTSETTRPTPRDASLGARSARFAGKTVSRVIAHGNEGVDGSSPSEGFGFLPA